MTRAKLLLPVLLLVPRLLLACEPSPGGSPFDGLCGVVAGKCGGDEPRILVLSAFPYEQKMLREMTEVTETLDFQGRSLLVGRLAGQPVLLRLTGIGLENARLTTEAILAQFDVSAIVFAGVAGTQQRVGDVTVPATWTDIASGHTFGVDPSFLAAAERVAATNPTLSTCTVVPDDPTRTVCLEYAPTVIVGGAGTSSDPYNGGVFPCQPNIQNRRDIFGCEADAPIVVPQGGVIAVDAVDMETAAVAEVAAAHGLPFIGVRAASDGNGVPGTAGTFEQFFIYYRLASDNEAVVTAKLLAELPGATATPAKTRKKKVRTRTAATCSFERSAAVECAGVAAPRRIERLVSAACALRAKVVGGKPRTTRFASKAAARWQRAATLVERGKLPSCCAQGLAQRLRAAADMVTVSAQTRLPW